MPDLCQNALFLVSVSSDLAPGATETVAVGGDRADLVFVLTALPTSEEVCKLEVLEGNFL